MDNKHYVDNEVFLKLLEEYKKTNVISEELGEIFFNIAHNLSFSGQFINYTDSWKNEMISDALYNCCRYAGSFKPEKGSNPFAYFTTTAVNAFIMRIKKEKMGLHKTDIIRDKLYDEFLRTYQLTAGTHIKNTEDYQYCLDAEKGESNDT